RAADRRVPGARRAPFTPRSRYVMPEPVDELLGFSEHAQHVVQQRRRVEPVGRRVVLRGEDALLLEQVDAGMLGVEAARGALEALTADVVPLGFQPLDDAG